MNFRHDDSIFVYPNIHYFTIVSFNKQMCWENATWKNYFVIFLVAGASGKPIAHPTFLPLAPLFKTAGTRCITLSWTHIPFRGYLCCLFVIFKKVLYPKKSNSSICGLPVTCTTITFIHLYHYYSLHICFVVVVVVFFEEYLPLTDLH